MRINKYLADKGYATRRGVDDLIIAKKVLINGRLAVLGDKVEESDVVEVRGSNKVKNYSYFAYNKPRGVATAERGGDEIREALRGIPEAKNLFPVGRLDKDSHGLMILTNDGRITDRLLNPEHDHEKEYRVHTVEDLRDSFTKHMSAGVDIGDHVTKPAKVVRESDRSFRITLGEGKKHQIRRMVDALHNGVKDLERIRVMNIRLAGLAPDAIRKIEDEELATFLKSLGL